MTSACRLCSRYKRPRPRTGNSGSTVLHPVEASLLGVKADEQIKVVVEGSQFELAVMLRADLPRGVAGLSIGLSPVEGITLPAFGKVAPIPAELSARGAS